MRYIKIFLFLSALSFIISPLSASTSNDSCRFEIKGKIIDLETNTPIPFATVKLKNIEKGAITDENGNFTIKDICNKSCTIECSHIGYKPITHHHDAYHDEPIIYMAPSVAELESVVVEGKSISGDVASMSIEKINKKALSINPSQSMASVLSEVQGVTFTSTGSNVQLPVIHGLYGNRILIVNNGVKHGFQNWGADHAPEIDISNAHNITLLKGAAGVRYGPEALGGAVLIESNPLQLSKKFEGNVSSGFQSNGRGYHATLDLGQGYEKWSYHIGGSYNKIGDRHAPDYMLTNSGKEEKALNIGLRYHLHDFDFKLNYSFVDQNLALLRASVASSGDLFTRSLESDTPLFIRDFSYAINEPNQKTQHHLTKLSGRWYSPVGLFHLQLSQQLNSREEFDVRRNADRPIIDLDLNTTDVQFDWEHLDWGNLEGMIGIQLYYQNNDNNPGTSTTPFIPNYNTFRLSTFVIESYVKEKTTYELGLRLDHESNSVRGRETNQDIFRNQYQFTNITASFGLVHKPSDQLRISSNIGSAWRTPNMAELYSFGQHGFKSQFGLWRYYNNSENQLRTDKVLTQEDGAISPEKGYKWINEISFKKASNTFLLTAYANYIENYIFDRPIGVFGTIRGPMPVFIYDQANAFLAGIDFNWKHKITDPVEGNLGGSYLYAQNIEKNEPLINQPPANINYEIKWKLKPILGLTSHKLSLKSNYVFQQFQAPRTITARQLIEGEVQITSEAEIFDFKDAPSGYFLLKAQWEWELNNFGGLIAINNLLNTRYRDYLNQMRYFADEIGRNFLFTINYKF